MLRASGARFEVSYESVYRCHGTFFENLCIKIIHSHKSILKKIGCEAAKILAHLSGLSLDSNMVLAHLSGRALKRSYRGLRHTAHLSGTTA